MRTYQTVIRVLTAVALVGLVVGTVAAQQLRNQDIVNTELSERASSLERRVANIEAIRPDAVAIRLTSLERQVSDQGILLYGILAAVIINLLTGGNRIPALMRRKSQHESVS